MLTAQCRKLLIKRNLAKNDRLRFLFSFVIFGQLIFHQGKRPLQCVKPASRGGHTLKVIRETFIGGGFLHQY